MLRYYIQIIGILIFISSGLLLTSLWTRSLFLANISEKLETSTETGFAELKHGQEIKIPGLKTHYFYTYSGIWNNKPFEKLEQIDSDFYLILSEGKNVDILVVQGAAGEIYTHLKKNKLPYGKKFDILESFSLWWNLAGILMIIAPFFSRKKSKMKDQVSPS